MSEINRLIALNPFQPGADVYGKTLQGFELGRQRQTQLERQAIEERERNRLEAERQQQMAQQAQANRMFAANPNLTPMDLVGAGLWGYGEKLAKMQDVMSESQRRQAQTQIGQRQTAVQESKEAREQAKYQREMQRPQSEYDPDYIKELTKRTQDDRDRVNKEAVSFRKSMGKINNLVQQAKNPKTKSEYRAAVNSLIANVVTLNTPGIVQMGELQVYSGGQTPTSALLDYLRNKVGPNGERIDVDAISAYLDPAGNADVEGLQRLAGNLILGQAGPLFDEYADIQERASILPQKRRENIFRGARNINALYEMQEKLAQPDEEPIASPPQDPARKRTRTTQQVDALETAKTQGWPLMVDANGNKAYVGPNNEIVEVD